MKIWRIIIVNVLLLLSLNQVNAASTNITSFSDLVQAVESGNEVRAIIHFDNCLVTEPSIRTQVTRRLNGATTGFNFTHYFHAQETINQRLIDTVTTPIKFFIERPTGESLILSGRLNVFEDNTATLHLSFFDPILQKEQLVVDWTCTISNGQDNNGLVLFDIS
ncbi:hypothetical protein [Legionella saoudiensis]|uniref:hypothetical protein n=1 Tax=Legionella saoudiensis TaxID=1750561 RepID=UPI0007300DEC|nr:hypothetical protein [Legionella saoudiensis]